MIEISDPAQSYRCAMYAGFLLFGANPPLELRDQPQEPRNRQDLEGGEREDTCTDEPISLTSCMLYWPPYFQTEDHVYFIRYKATDEVISRCFESKQDFIHSECQRISRQNCQRFIPILKRCFSESGNCMLLFIRDDQYHKMTKVACNPKFGSAQVAVSHPFRKMVRGIISSYFDCRENDMIASHTSIFLK